MNQYVWGKKKEIESDITASMTTRSLSEIVVALNILSPKITNDIETLKVNETYDVEVMKQFAGPDSTIESLDIYQILRLS